MALCRIETKQDRREKALKQAEKWAAANKSPKIILWRWIIMPGMDGTGPYGNGPRAGYCPYGRGLGFRQGKGFGRGFGARFLRNFEPVELSKEERIKILKAEKESIEKELSELEND